MFCDSSGDGGCQQMTVNVSNTDSFRSICSAVDSCSEMSVHLRFDDDIGNRNDYGAIYCVEHSACDHLNIQTTSQLTQLFLYEQSDLVIFDNGAGYVPELENVVCVTDKWIRFDGFLENNQTVMDSINVYYPDYASFPCSDVTVLCGNVSDHKSCSMSHEISLHPISSLFEADEDVCTMVKVQDLHTVSCDGECPSSPTLPPTNAPTNSPTVPPSNAPSQPPTNYPSEIPSVPPTNAPSDSPTISPTKMPTEMDDFDSFVECEYKLSGLNTDELSSISSNITNFSTASASLIHSGFDHDPILEYHQIWVNVSGLNGYSLDVLPEDKTKLFEHRNYITIQSQTLCPAAYCQVISGESAVVFDQTEFTHFVTPLFRQYFGENGVVSGESRDLSVISEIEFSILKIGKTMDLHPIPIPLDMTPYLYSICGVFGSVGVLAFLYQRGYVLCCSPKVDTSGWIAWISLALQLWDFLSDIMLNREMWSTPRLMDRQNKMLLIVAVGATAFVVIPYALNLYIGCFIKKFIKKNEAAMIWYVVFVLLHIDLKIFKCI